MVVVVLLLLLFVGLVGGGGGGGQSASQCLPAALRKGAETLHRQGAGLVELPPQSTSREGLGFRGLDKEG